jgi:hypothetical protein
MRYGKNQIDPDCVIRPCPVVLYEVVVIIDDGFLPKLVCTYLLEISGC